MGPMHAEMFVEGAISYDEAAAAMSECMEIFTEAARSLPESTGALIMRITVEPQGTVKSVELLTDTLVPRPWDVSENDVRSARASIQHAVLACFSEHKFPEKKEQSQITMPLLFE
jgi:hypothetical protein